MRVGFGFDVHRLEEGRPLVIGGVEIPYEKGPIGHSDGDALLHAIADALLGAAALGDIGLHFPDTDERWRGADSKDLLRSVVEMLREAGYRLGNVDSTVVLERPRLRPHIGAMRSAVAECLCIEPGLVSIKATTHEQMDAIGSGSGIAAYAVCTIFDVGRQAAE